MEESIPHLDVRLATDANESYLFESAQHLVKTFRPEWREEKLTCKLFTEGITNRLIGVYKDKRNMILVRVHGENTDLFIDRKKEFRHLAAMYKAGFSVPIYCSFTNGICYGFSPGRVLDYESVTDPLISKLVAERLAQMHSIKPDSNPRDPQSCLFPMINKYLELIASALPRLPILTKYKHLQFENLQMESKFLKHELIKLNSPIVFCHNDLLLKNIVFDDKTSKVAFIDYEYSDYNYQAFDIANHFSEFCGVDPFDPSRFPSEEFQLTWLANYLRKWCSLNGEERKFNQDLVLDLYEAVEKFSLAAHLLWGLWALVQVTNSTINFDYGKFALSHLDEYFARKNKLFHNNNNITNNCTNNHRCY